MGLTSSMETEATAMNFAPLILDGTYLSPDTELRVKTANPVSFVVSKDGEFFLAKNEELGLHTYSRTLALLETELIEEIAFILKFVKDKPSSKKIADQFSLA